MPNTRRDLGLHTLTIQAPAKSSGEVADSNKNVDCSKSITFVSSMPDHLDTSFWLVALISEGSQFMAEQKNSEYFFIFKGNISLFVIFLFLNIK